MAMDYRYGNSPIRTRQELVQQITLAHTALEKARAEE
ncbi:MAG: hypothetical protein BMS9Abin20_0032 [Acidimicrobiia bacterium]|nr:MAG: hypothetical protein BMS9Abin20_0032 [Acidimicrobiia bacterium]